jgi:DNA processing protein
MDELKEERKYWLALSVCDGIGPIRFQKLLHFFGSAKKAWFAAEKELNESGIGEKISADVISFKESFSLEEYEGKLRKSKIEYFTLQDSNYPELLKQIKNPPIVLYKKGTLEFNGNDILVSVVGTRRVTNYGREVTELLVSDLAEAGCIIVSGLAMGVDALAHKATIDAKGKTIAVLGSGVDVCTPTFNIALYNSILENGGAIVSENPLGRLPNKGSFPMRNRIIAGLSLGVVVTEGSEDSGSLITAKDAFENNRRVFAVPGPITSSVSKGPISLIAKGAQIVTSAADIIKGLGFKNHKIRSEDKKKITGLSKEEQKVIDLLQNQSLHFDEIVKRTGFNPSKLGTLLSLMEVKGLIKSLEAGFFV